MQNNRGLDPEANLPLWMQNPLREGILRSDMQPQDLFSSVIARFVGVIGYLVLCVTREQTPTCSDEMFAQKVAELLLLQRSKILGWTRRKVVQSRGFKLAEARRTGPTVAADMIREVDRIAQDMMNPIMDHMMVRAMALRHEKDLAIYSNEYLIPDVSSDHSVATTGNGSGNVSERYENRVIHFIHNGHLGKYYYVKSPLPTVVSMGWPSSPSSRDDTVWEADWGNPELVLAQFIEFWTDHAY